MENLPSYLARKSREIERIRGGLTRPESAALPRSVEDVIDQKFRAGADMKAERAEADWQLTETHWSDAASFKVGPFEVGYSYQRADLAIRGPLLYEPPNQDGGHEIIWSSYTSCGMSAMATLLLALARSFHRTILAMRPDCYPETRELVANYGSRLGIVPVLTDPIGFDQRGERGALRVVLVDSGVPTRFSQPGPMAGTDASLVIFDTTCLAVSSSRLAAVLRRTGKARLPVVLVRSHTKLDSLGIEYGRLGSLVVMVPRLASPSDRDLAERLAKEMQDAMRLFGTAAVPAHLPQFMGGPRWRALYRDRISRIIRNNRRAARSLSALVSPQCRVTGYQHGLFLTITPPFIWDEQQARRMARMLAESLRTARLPVRPAGSFGFDFAVVDAFPARERDGYCLRLALADLPDTVVDDIIGATARWEALMLASA